MDKDSQDSVFNFIMSHLLGIQNNVNFSMVAKIFLENNWHRPFIKFFQSKDQFVDDIEVQQKYHNNI